VGEEVREVKPFDLVTIPSWTWHQFRATKGEPLGFLCMVNTLRDRPQLPSEQDLAALKAIPGVATFLGR
jgi:quercetin dioxygenase-like cupin family protein